ncbi:MAG TPA: hypothetical protein VGG34_01330 [Opitutaceae bacterium]|jgi:hypothetical protein
MTTAALELPALDVGAAVKRLRHAHPDWEVEICPRTAQVTARKTIRGEYRPAGRCWLGIPVPYQYQALFRGTAALVHAMIIRHERKIQPVLDQ